MKELPQTKTNRLFSVCFTYLISKNSGFRFLSKTSVLIFSAVFFSLVVPQIASATIYAPGATLEPDCAPTDVNCGVVAPANSGINSSITSLTGLTTPLSSPQGGTGFSIYSIGDILYAISSSTLAKLGIGTNGQFLSVSSGTPAWVTGITSIFGRTGNVTSQSGDYTASQITNTPAGNITATSTQEAINQLDTNKENAVTAGTASQYYRGDKTFQTLDTAAVTENPSALYFSTTRARDALSSAITAVNYSTTTGSLTLASGYTIPLTASTTEWASSLGNMVTSWTGPLNFANGVVTMNQASATSSGYLSSSDYNTLTSAAASSSIAASTSTDGYLTAANFNIFNNKENAVTAGTASQYYRGDKTFQTLDTAAVTENPSALYFSTTRARDALSSAITAVNYSTTTGSLTLASGYTIPLTASTTEWASSLGNMVTSWTGPLNFANGVVTMNQASATSSGYLSSSDYNTLTSAAASSSIAASTSTDGYLTAANFNIFNNKENAVTAGTASQYYRGDKTFQTLDTAAVTENPSALYFSTTRARDALSSAITAVNYSTTTGSLTLASGYTIPLTASTTEWASSLGNMVTSWTGPLNFANGVVTMNQASATSSGYLSSSDYNTLTSAAASSSIAASTSTDGYLTAANFNIFNNKENAVTAGTASQYYRGDKTFQTLDTAAVTENPSALYFSTTRARDALSSAITAVNYSTTTGSLTLASGYTIPLTASTTEWASSLGNMVTSWTGPLSFANGVVSIANSSATTTGVLSSTDYNTFNNKEGAIASGTTGEYFRGDKTFQTLDTAAVTENPSALYFSTTRARDALSSAITAVNYSTTTGSLTLASGYTIPLTASTTEWASSLGNMVTSWTGPLNFANGVVTMNQASATSSGYLSSSDYNTLTSAAASSSIAASTSTDGYLTAANFNIFNNKENAVTAGTASQYYRGDKTFQTLDTAAVTENPSALYFSTTRARDALSSAITAVNYSTTTGSLTLASGYTIPLTASTTEWASSLGNMVTSWTGPLSFANGVVSIANSSATTTGVLSSTDYNTFNNKEGAIASGTTGEYFRGDKTFQTLDTAAVTENPSALYFSTTRARDALSSAITAVNYSTTTGSLTLASGYTIPLTASTTEWASSLGNMVTSWTGPLSFANGVVSIANSSATTTGVLSSTDYNTFNNKEGAIASGTTGEYFRGDKTFQTLDTAAVTENPSALYFSTTRARDALSSAITAVNYSTTTGSLTLASGYTIPLTASTTEWASSLGNMVTSWTGPLSFANGVVSIANSSATTTGVLSSTDYNTFNNKEGAIASGTTGEYFRGDKTFQTLDTAAVTENPSALYFSTTRARDALSSAITAVNYSTTTGSLTLASGYTIPLTASTTEWASSLGNMVTSWTGPLSFANGVVSIANSSATTTGVLSSTDYNTFNNKEGAIASGTTGEYFRGDKTFQTLDTAAVTENPSALYFSTTRARDALSSAITAVNYSTTTGSLTLASGYTIPLTASTTEWASSLGNMVTSWTGPLSFANGVVSIANSSATTTGVLSSTDYNTFNNKEGAIASGTTGEYFRGDKTFQTLDTAAVTENPSALYFSTTRARDALSSAITAVNYSTTTGSLTLASGYTIPLTASTTEWASSLGNMVTSWTGPLSFANGVVSIANSSATTTGVLSSTDYNTFNNKEGAIASGTTGEYFRGDKTFQTLDTAAVTENPSALYFSTTRARDALSSAITAVNYSTTTGSLTLASGYTIPLTASTTEWASSLGNMVTSWTGPLSFANGVVSIANSSATTTGVLSSTDYNTFNNKENAVTAGTASQYYRGDKTFQTLDTAAVTENPSALYFSTTRARDALSSAITAVNYSTTTGSLTLASGYTIPLTASTTEWASSLGNMVTSWTGPLSFANGVVSIANSSATTTGVLSSTDWNIFNNKVPTSLTINTTGPLTGGGDLSNNRTIAINQAGLSSNGYLSSTDWATFNNKQNALGFTAENSANKSTDTNLGTSNTLYPTQNAVKAYVDNMNMGLNWHDPLIAVNIVTATSTPIASPRVNDVYIINTGGDTGDWASFAPGDMVQYQTLTGWVKLKSLVVGDHFGVTFKTPTIPSGDMAGKYENLAEITGGTPGAFTYTFTAPQNNDAIFVSNQYAYFKNISFVYAEVIQVDPIPGEWVQISGSSDITYDNGLHLTGNVLSLGNLEMNWNQNANFDINTAGNIGINGGNLTTTSTIASLFNTNANTLYIGGAATSISLGAAGATVTGGGALTIKSGTTTSLTLDSGGTGDLNIGTGSNAKNINIGNTSGSTSLTLKSGTGNINLSSGSGNVQVGNGTPSASPNLLVFDTKNTTGDPTGTNGAVYYNSYTGKFRCYESGAWKDCRTNINSGSPELTYSTSTETLSVSSGYAIPTIASSTDWATSFARSVSSWTGPLNFSNGIASIAQASSSASGYLSSTDWNTFNNKQANIAAGTNSQYYRGDKTFQTLDTLAVPENTNLYYTDARARAAHSTTATGLTYSTSTGVLGLAANYSIPLTASTTEGSTAYTRSVSTWTGPLSFLNGTASINQASSTASGYLSSTDYNTFNNAANNATTTARNSISNTVTGLTYSTSTGVTSLTAGYNVPLAASTTDWATSFARSVSSWTGPLNFSNGIASIAQASSSASGYLSSTDWNTFNNKQANIAAGTNSQYYRGDKTFQTLDTLAVPENTNLYYTDARARAAHSTTATGLTYSTSTGVLGLAANYSIPLTASTTDWTSAFNRSVTSWSGPLSLVGGVASISKASSTAAGYLSSTDYNTFNNAANNATTTARNSISNTVTGLTYSTTTGVTSLTAGYSVPLTASTTEGSTAYTRSVSTWTGPLSFSNGVASISQASSTALGYLSSTDWNTFNNKQANIAAGTNSQYYRGDKTFQNLDTTAVTENGNLYYTDTRARSALSNSATGLTYSSSTGATSLTSGYAIPTTSSSADWTTAFTRSVGSWTGPLSFSGGVASISQASSTALGYLSSTDWNTFNNKQANIAAGTNSQYYRGDKTFQNLDTTAVTENGNLYYTDTRARSALSNSATGLTYSSSTGATSLTSGYAIPTTSSSADWTTAFTRSVGSWTGPLSFSGGVASISQASSTALGYLSSTDWNTFNNKQANIAAGTNSQYYRGDKTFQNLDTTAVTENGNLYYTDTRARSALSNSATGLTYSSSTGATSLTSGYAIPTTSSSADWTTAFTRSVGSWTGPLSFSGGVASISQASSTALGYLSSTDWNTFNNKQANIAAGTNSQYYRGDKTFQNLDTTAVTENGNLYYTDTRARAAHSTTATGLTYSTLTGVLSSTAGYSIPLTASTTEGSTAYTRSVSSWTGPLSFLNGIASINQASSSASGYLSSTDYTTFANKISGAGNGLTTSGTNILLGNLTSNWNQTGAFDINTTGNISINGGDLKTSSTTATVFNTNATSLKIGGDATSISLGAAGATVTGGGALTINSGSATALSLDSGTTGALNIGTGSNAKTITIGNGTGATSLVLNAGTGNIDIGTTAFARNINIGTGAAAQTVTIGSASSTSSLTLQSGSGNIRLVSGTGNVQIGSGTPSATPDLLILDTKNTSGDPTGTNGAMYYNSNTNKFRCYQNSAWTNCIGAGSDIQQARTLISPTAVAGTTSAAATKLGTVSITPTTATGDVYVYSDLGANSLNNTNQTITAEIRTGSTCNAGSIVGTSTMYVTDVSGSDGPSMYVTGIVVNAGASLQTYVICAYNTTASGSNLGGIAVAMVIDTGADLAEIYTTNDSSMEAGDVVSLDSSLEAGVKKTEKAYDKKVFGIVSTRPGSLIGGADKEGTKAVPLALSGRVPVKVTTENGNIESGDYLTPSSIPGVAMKSNGSGPVIGQAIFSYGGQGVGLVLTFVKNFDLGDSSVLLGKTSLDLNATSSENGLALLVDTIQSETPQDPISIITTKITEGKQFLTNFIAARVTAIRGYFDEIFARKIHTGQLCVKKSNGSEICVDGDQLGSVFQGISSIPAEPIPSNSPSTNIQTSAPEVTGDQTSTTTSSDISTTTPSGMNATTSEVAPTVAPTTDTSAPTSVSDTSSSPAPEPVPTPTPTPDVAPVPDTAPAPTQ